MRVGKDICFHILGLHYMLPGISLLKGKEKLLLQDRIFERIAEKLNWHFVPIEQLLAEVKRDEQDRLQRIAESYGREQGS